MSKFDEILNSSDASDALLGEQIDKINESIEESKNEFAVSITNETPVTAPNFEKYKYVSIMSFNSSSQILNAMTIPSSIIKGSRTVFLRFVSASNTVYNAAVVIADASITVTQLSNYARVIVRYHNS